MSHRAAVLGTPIAHSLSPVLHNAGYAAAGLVEWAYTAVECAEDELGELIGLLGPEWAGLSLTMPLKEAALSVADEVDPAAAAIGAANTLIRVPTGWRADNTDAPGMVDALASAGMTVASRVAILGAGGTARAAIACAAALRAADVRVYARRRAAVAEMAPAAELLGTPVTHVDWAEADTCADADLVISTVPKGVADALRPAWRPGTVVFDVVYDPWPTPLTYRAAAAGCAIVSGLDLLLHQAARQFVMFTGVPAPLDAMRAALRAARPGSQRS
ncbi:MAG TPA: shikimate dehydrogenase [Micromonosporaceae bacterium]|nr:shikimate dehydrogenase [Micromonosporaceae bacterium]